VDFSFVWTRWPGLANRLLWTVVTLGVAYALGHAVRLILGARFRSGRGRADDWVRVLAEEIRSRVPFWALLAGAHISLSRWPLHPRNADTIHDIISALAIASATFAASAVATRLVAAYGPRATPAVAASALSQNVIRIVITLLGVLMIVKAFGADITGYLTALGVGGLAVALALQDPLSNLFAGIFMSVSGQIRLGEYVKLDSGLEGYILDFNWRATSIRLLSGNVAIVPNAKLSQSTVTNFHQPSRDVSVGLEVGIDYANDLALVERVTLEVARAVIAEVPGAMKTSSPSARYHSFGPPLITLAISMRSEEVADQFLLKHELIKRLHARYVAEGVAMRPSAEIVPARTT
jgi:small-conductance mechanosensitive channel